MKDINARWYVHGRPFCNERAAINCAIRTSVNNFRPVTVRWTPDMVRQESVPILEYINGYMEQVHPSTCA